MRMPRTLAAALMGATMLWTVAPVLAASTSPGAPAVAQSQAPTMPAPAPAVQNPALAPQSATPAAKGPAMTTKEEARPALHAVIKDLEQARTTLQKEKTPDADGHRVKAAQSIDQALRELQLALKMPTR